MKRYISLIVFVFFLCVHVFANSPSATLKKMSSLKEKTETEKLLEEKNMDLLVSPQLAMSTRDYMVTAGDIYTLAYAVGTNPVTYTIPVDSSYKIRVSNMAVIDAKGKSFLQIKKQVEDIVTRNFPMSGVQFVLTQPAIFKVNIIGEVEKTVVKESNKSSLDDTTQLIFDIIGVEPKGFDEIQILTALSTEELLIRLTEMELSGLIEQVEGDRYKRTI